MRNSRGWPASRNAPSSAASAGTTASRPSSTSSASRVRTACHALVHTDHSIAVDRADHGFPDQSYFTREFREVIGKTPRDYRNAFKRHGGPEWPPIPQTFGAPPRRGRLCRKNPKVWRGLTIGRDPRRAKKGLTMDSFLITNVRILDGTGREPFAGAVRVEGNRIAEVARRGRAATSPPAPP